MVGLGSAGSLTGSRLRHRSPAFPPVEGCPSGLRGRTVNPLANAYVGSNPTPSTRKPKSAWPRGRSSADDGHSLNLRIEISARRGQSCVAAQ